MGATDLAQAEPLRHADLPSAPGCYVLVADHEAMRELDLQACSGQTALYVGKSEDSIRKRASSTHLTKNRTGSSTLRRSVGALLRLKLDLHPQPRSPKRTEKDIQNYKFDCTGETRLTEWIAANLRVMGVESCNPKATEGKLISGLHPPLNLMGWENPHGEMIRAARAECANLARGRA